MMEAMNNNKRNSKPIKMKRNYQKKKKKRKNQKKKRAQLDLRDNNKISFHQVMMMKIDSKPQIKAKISPIKVTNKLNNNKTTRPL